MSFFKIVGAVLSVLLTITAFVIFMCFLLAALGIWVW